MKLRLLRAVNIKRAVEVFRKNNDERVRLSKNTSVVMRDNFQTVSLVQIERKTPLLGLGILHLRRGIDAFLLLRMLPHREQDSTVQGEVLALGS